MNKIKEIPIRSYAHIGDAVYELYIREKTIFLTSKPDCLHKITVSLVNAEFQVSVLLEIENILTEQEEDIVRRARNLSVTTSRRVNHKLHRLSTAFEALIGFLYLTDKDRLQFLFNHVDKIVEEKLSKLSEI